MNQSFGRKKRMQGLHEHSHRDENGKYRNTCAPRSRRQKPTKAEAKLEARIKAFQTGMKGAKFAAHQPGSLNFKKG